MMWYVLEWGDVKSIGWETTQRSGELEDAKCPYWFTEQPEWLRNSTSYQQEGLSSLPLSDHQFLFESPLSQSQETRQQPLS